MQSVDIEPNKEERLEKLKQDFEKPFSPPVDIKEVLPKDYPELDTGIDAHEWYDEGASGAAEITVPPRGRVLKYRTQREVEIDRAIYLVDDRTRTYRFGRRNPYWRLLSTGENHRNKLSIDGYSRFCRDGSKVVFHYKD